MTEKEKLPQSENTSEKKPNLSKDFEHWLKKTEQLHTAEQQNSQETISKLANFRETLGSRKLRETTPKNPEKISDSNHKDVRTGYEAMGSIETRHGKEMERGVGGAMLDSVAIFGGAIRDVGKDIAEVVLHPVKTTQDTITFLKEESPNTEIV